jgi:hypothetical protein
MKTKTPLFRTAALFALALLATFAATHEAKAQYLVTTLGTAVTENFSSYAGTAAPTNWTLNAGNRTNLSIQAPFLGNDTGSNTSGGWRNYGTGSLGFFGHRQLWWR